MTNRTFSVTDDIFERFPDYVVGWVSASFNPGDTDEATVSALLRAAEERVQVIHKDRDLKELPAISVWRSAFSSMGWSASKYLSSVEALTRRVSRGGTLPSINPAVDLANSVSLVYSVPVGCHDLDQTEHLQVRLARPGDTFNPMGEGAEETPDQGEIVYASGSKVRTRRWVWRQSRSALVSSESSWIFLPVDGFIEVTGSNVEAAVEYLSTACESYLDAQVESGWIDRHSTNATLAQLHLEVGE